MPTPVTDPDLLAQLNSDDSSVAGPKPVTDPKILAQLNSDQPAMASSVNPSDAVISQDYPTRRGIMRFARPILEYGGMAAGGTIGAGTGTVAEPGGGTIVGGLAGAGLGYAAGKKAADIVEEALGIRKTPPLTEQLKQSVKDVATGAAIQGTGDIAGNVVTKLFAPFAKTIKPEAAEVAQEATSKGISLTPAEITQSKPLALVESGLEKLPGSSGIFQRQQLSNLSRLVAERNRLIEENGSPESIDMVGSKIKAGIDQYLQAQGAAKSQALEQLRDKALSQLGSRETYESLGMKTADLLETASKARSAKINELYGSRDALIPDDAQIPINNTIGKAREFVDKMKGQPASMQPSGPIVNILNDLSGKSGNVGFNELPKDAVLSPTGLRSTLNSIIANENAALATQAKGMTLQNTPAGYIAGQLKSTLDQDVAAYSPSVANMTDIANKFTSESKQLFNDPNLLRLIRANPEKAFSVLVGPGKTTELNVLRQAIGDEGFQPIKDKLTERILGADTLKPFSPQGVQQQLNRYGMETLQSIYSPEELQSLQNIAKRGFKIQDLMDTSSPGRPDQIFNSILRSQPEKVIDKIVRPNITTDIDAVERATGPEGLQMIREKFLESTILKLNRQGNFSPASVATTINKYGTAIPRLFQDDPETLQAIQNMARIGQMAKGAEKLAGNPSGTAQALQSTNLVTAIAGGRFRRALEFTPGPWVIARAYLSPAGRRWLTQGFQTAPTWSHAGELVVKLAAIISREDESQNQIESHVSPTQTQRRPLIARPP